MRVVAFRRTWNKWLILFGMAIARRGYWALPGDYAVQRGTLEEI